MEGLTEFICVFRGSAREAAVGFPANINVAVALSLAGIGPDRTTIEIWADPAGTRNVHHIEVEADFGALFDVDREYSERKSQDRTNYRALSNFLFAQIGCLIACRKLIGAVLLRN